MAGPEDLAKLREKFTDEEIEHYINCGKKLAAKSVIHLLKNLIEDATTSANSKAAVRLQRKIDATIPYDYSGYACMTFAETPYKLHVCLSLVGQDYKTDIDIIDNPAYIRELFDNYVMLKKTAMAYWVSYCHDHPAVVLAAEEFLAGAGIDRAVLDALRPDPANATVLWFRPESSKRIGIFCYYVDANGRPLYKKQKGARS